MDSSTNSEKALSKPPGGALQAAIGAYLEPSVVKQQVQVIQQVMREAMKENEHYGTIPGCGDKKVLMKSGAEKLGFTFRIAPEYEVNRADLPGGHREYQVTCRLRSIHSGDLVGSGVGLCSTMESKYRWRNGELKCPSCGKSGTVIKGKAEFGGGWLCWQRKDGCGAKFEDGDPRIEKQPRGRVDNPDIADTFNTVLKMAKKRAHVDAILTATAASDIFTQDLEDTVVGEVIDTVAVEPPPAEPPGERPRPAPVPDQQPVGATKRERIWGVAKTQAEAIEPAAGHERWNQIAAEKIQALLPVFNAQRMDDVRDDMVDAFLDKLEASFHQQPPQASNGRGF
jgi:hypothetical protein